MGTLIEFLCSLLTLGSVCEILIALKLVHYFVLFVLVVLFTCPKVEKMIRVDCLLGVHVYCMVGKMVKGFRVVTRAVHEE